ncbi:MFS transporter [Saccharopolyspora cebuensis]|uniref:MFS transporter n=1 Tax=Saccharopolyspora cebuensis TaxID=418759 RepID=A0ABV4C9V7_9PSEU
MSETTVVAPARARGAVSALFLLNGATFASMVPRYPEVKAGLELSGTAFGAAVAAAPVGSILAGLVTGALLRRWRSGQLAVWGSALLAADVVLVGVAGQWWALAGVLLLCGMLDAVVDVSMNAHGLRVQRRYGRSIVNSFHALWSIGAIVGGLLGSLAAGLAVPVAVHLAITGAATAGAALVARRFLLPGPDDAERSESARPAGRRLLPGPAALRPLVLLGLLCASAALIEDTAASWGAVYLRGDLGAAPALAGLVFVALQSTQAVGRLFGDRLVNRFGARAVARSGAVLVVVGVGGALLWPSVPGTVLGFALAGFGVATVIPAGFNAADDVPGLSAGVGLTAVGWVYRVGLLAGPPVVGVLADAAGLRFGLLVVPAVAVLMLLLAGRLPARRT